jgi:IS30 family transposase
MSKHYTQLSLEQRYQLEVLFGKGFSQKEIAESIGRSPSTICRELRRNMNSRGPGAGIYNAVRAQEKAETRHQLKPKQLYFTHAMKEYTRRRLEQDKWSPEIISVKGREEMGNFVSHESLYKWIWESKLSQGQHIEDRKLYRHLKHGHRRRKRGLRKDCRGHISNRVFIQDRPTIVEQRQRLGDFEVDLMMGKNHQGALVVMTDRSSLMTELVKVKSKRTKVVSRAIKIALAPYKEVLQTLTFDNDQAFALHEGLARDLGVETYFTRPYTSQDKGTVENRIGVVRRFFPKKTDLTMVTNKEVKAVQEKINDRPVRKFNYKSANQIFSEKIAVIT